MIKLFVSLSVVAIFSSSCVNGCRGLIRNKDKNAFGKKCGADVVKTAAPVTTSSSTTISNYYNDSTSITNGFATTPTGKSIVYTANALGVNIWKESGGSRVLSANGSDDWQLELNGNGKTFSATEYTSPDSIKCRVCPTYIYIDESDRAATGKCLYCDEVSGAKLALNGQGVDGILGVNDWDNYNAAEARWYVGNIKTCSDKGMRLPTAFETGNADSNGVATPSDSAASLTGDGITDSVLFWTASSVASVTSAYFGYDFTDPSLGNGVNNSVATFYVKCVLPGN